MRRRFSRRRRGGGSGDGKATPIDAARALGRIAEAGIVPGSDLQVLEHDDIPADYAAIGTGQGEDGSRVIVSFSPASAGDALLAALATGSRLAEEDDFSGEVVVVAPRWSTAARRRLGLLAQTAFSLRTAEAAQLAEGGAVQAVAPEPEAVPAVLSVQSVASQLSTSAERELFGRVAASLEGLASKHAGAVRGCGNTVELVILARRVAVLSAGDGGIQLETILQQRSSSPVSSDDVAQALDQFEGNLRKLLNDRRIRDGEEGMRARVIPILASASSLRGVSAWPLSGSDHDVIDLIGVDASGTAVIGAIREHFGLRELGSIFDAALVLQPALPTLLAGVEAPVKFATPRLVVAAKTFGSAATRALSALGLGYELFEVRAPRGRGFEVTALGSGAAARLSRPEPQARSRDRQPTEGESERPDGRGPRRRSRRPRSDRDDTPQAEAAAPEASPEAGAGAEAGSDSPRSGPRRGRRSGGRGRGSRSRSGSGSPDRASEAGSDEAAPQGVRDAASARPAPRFDEMSSFDLEDEGSSETGSSQSRGRGRSRRRGRRGGGRAGASSGEEDSGASDEEPTQPEPEAGDGPAGEDTLIVEDEDGGLASLAALPEEASDSEVQQPAYDEEEDLGDDADSAEHAATVERERRRRARLAKAEPEAPARPPRRRAVILAHGDRDSLTAAIVLARDVRLLEGLWVYPQADLMTFFRSVTTDLRDDTPIYLVGFTPSPARDVLQAAGLYSDRLVWFDHHVWPPEDADALKQSLAPEALHLQQGAGSSLPVVLETCTRRSRFSDKLVDLATGRFTLHDYERWGRLWWSRLGEIATKSGDVRSDIDALLVGRPSDLAREASRAPTPDLPREVNYVSRRDFRLVHFAGYSMVVADVDAEFDLHLVARIARERYDALLSLSYAQGDNLMILAGDELAGHRSLDLGAVVEHLSGKFQWLEGHPDDDHVARFRIRDFGEHPERLDDVVGAIAMGRSILER